MRYDVVIIGSGLGGLVSAAILSKNGMKTAVFEKHSVPGGCLQSFTRGGVKFETGMHYVGSMGKGEVMERYFRYLGISDALPLSRLDDDAYEIISSGGSRFSYASGHEAFVESLSRSFPSERDAIRRYVEICSGVTASSPMYSFGDHSLPLLNRDNLSRSVDEVIDSLTDDSLLRNVLAGINPLYCGVRGMTPLYIHSLIWDFYNRGAYRIAGGSDAIADALCTRIRENGGEIFLGSGVTKINSEGTEVRSVTVEGIGVVECGHVISDIHPQLLLGLVDSRAFRPVYSVRIRSLQQTISTFCVYIKFKPGRVPYLNSNFYNYSGDVWKSQSYDTTAWPANFLYMHQCSAADQKYATHAILMSYMDWREVERWSGTSVGQRDEEYNSFKQDRCERLLSALESEFPGTLAEIESCWTSSPLTYRDYTGTVNGSTYGILHDKANLEQTTVSQRTKLGNLFLAGQNINSHGVLGVTIGAVLACSELLGFDNLMRQIKRETE